MKHAELVSLYNEMYRLYYPRLLRSIPKLTFDHEEREDIAQETFARVWEGLQAGNYQELAHPFTWIYKIAIGASQRLIEQKHRQIPVHSSPPETVENEEHEDDDPDYFSVEEMLDMDGLIDYNTPEAVLMREQEEDEMDLTVDGLPDHYREVVAMFYYDGLSYQEIADQLFEGNTRRVDGILQRARAKLKSFLGEEDGELERYEDSGEGTPE